MTSFLDTAGALLYFVLSIVLIPLFLLTDCFLWSLVLVRYLQQRRYRRTPPAPQPHYHLQTTLH